jgi:hypothetical protein
LPTTVCLASGDLHLANAELRLALDPRLQLVGFAQRGTLEDTTAFNLRAAWEIRSTTTSGVRTTPGRSRGRGGSPRS